MTILTEIVNENKKNVRKSQRDLERELLALDREEKKVALEIKKLAKAGQVSSAKVLAKEIVRIRKQREKLLGMKAQLSAVNTRVSVRITKSHYRVFMAIDNAGTRSNGKVHGWCNTGN